MPSMRLGEIDISYNRQGAGFPILFIAGLSAGKDSWIPVANYLGNLYECITFDNRGIGESSKPEKGYTPQGLANDAVGLLDNLSINRAHVIGQSMGGTTAQLIALQRPELVSGLVLVSSSVFRDARTSYVLKSRKLLRERLNRYEYFLSIAPWFFGRESFSKPDFIDTWAKKQADKPNPQSVNTYGQLVDGWVGFDTRSQVKNITHPTLVVVGEDDILTRYQSQIIAELIPRAKLIVLPGLGHACTNEDPKLFADNAAKFLQNLPLPQS